MRAVDLSVRGIASVAVTVTTMLALMAPAHADNWGNNVSNAAKSAAQDYLNTKYANELKGHNVQLTKSEFGKFPVAHLGIDVLIDGILGGTLVYNPATNQVQVWGSTGGFSEAQDAKMYSADSSCFGSNGMEVSVGGVPTCIPGSLVGTASTVPTPYLISTTPGAAASCTWTPNGSDSHTC